MQERQKECRQVRVLGFWYCFLHMGHVISFFSWFGSGISGVAPLPSLVASAMIVASHSFQGLLAHRGYNRCEIISEYRPWEGPITLACRRTGMLQTLWDDMYHHNTWVNLCDRTCTTMHDSYIPCGMYVSVYYTYTFVVVEIKMVFVYLETPTNHELHSNQYLYAPCTCIPHTCLYDMLSHSTEDISKAIIIYCLFQVTEACVRLLSLQKA